MITIQFECVFVCFFISLARDNECIWEREKGEKRAQKNIIAVQSVVKWSELSN